MFTFAMQTRSTKRRGVSDCDCIRCGKAIVNEAPSYVELDNGCGESQGFFPIGSDCAKKVAKLGVTVVAATEVAGGIRS